MIEIYVFWIYFRYSMGFRTCYPKIWHLDILNISSWRNLRNSRCRKDFLTFFEASRKTFIWELPTLYPEEKSILIPRRGIWWDRPCPWPQSPKLSLYPLSYHIFLTTSHSSSNLAKTWDSQIQRTNRWLSEAGKEGWLNWVKVVRRYKLPR